MLFRFPSFCTKSAAAPVTTVSLVDFEGRRLVRIVRQVGEAYFARTHENVEDSDCRLLPLGKMGTPSKLYIHGWEPFSPPDWQPDGAETAHEAIRRMEVEKSSLQARVAELERFQNWAITSIKGVANSFSAAKSAA